MLLVINAALVVTFLSGLVFYCVLRSIVRAIYRHFHPESEPMPPSDWVDLED